MQVVGNEQQSGSIFYFRLIVNSEAFSLLAIPKQRTTKDFSLIVMKPTFCLVPGFSDIDVIVFIG